METNRTRVLAGFAIAIILAIVCLVCGTINTAMYNNAKHHEVLTGSALFAPSSAKANGVSIEVAPRGSTWTKAFDLNNEGITEHNYQAFTYDFTITDNTPDEVSKFEFTMTFDRLVFISSAWNGALEIHQNVRGEEIVDTVADMREYVPADHKLQSVTFDGEALIPLAPGDYLRYIPSTSMNAVEMPIEPFEATTPGIIMYVAIGEDIEGSTLDLEYSFNRLLTSEPLFWAGIVLVGLWIIALVILGVTSAQIRRYKERHERDNQIINESIETFTGFIDAKDPYTNGHSKRVATYTKLIAKELGYSGEELDRIYYIALLHDCGKIGVPDDILGKPDRLTDEEYEIMKSHTTRGGEILSRFKSLENADEGALYHHERYDGKGYPEGLAGEDIPFIARMICVADSFDVMNTGRVYRGPLPKDRILSELESNKGLQFDPEIADIMIKFIKDGTVGTS